jgi:REP element-mobilizing transposase RayT
LAFNEAVGLAFSEVVGLVFTKVGGLAFNETGGLEVNKAIVNKAAGLLLAPGHNFVAPAVVCGTVAAMPQSLSAVYAHLVFSTKNRAPFFKDAGFRAKVHAYLAGISKGQQCPALAIGGADDHVHVLARMGREVTQAGWVHEMKRASSLWMKTPDAGGAGMADFSWQSGYGIFSVSHSNVQAVLDYIATQEEHHKRVSFQEEFRKLLQKHGMEWDERYVWD